MEIVAHAGVTKEMLDLLREGAKTHYGRCCFPGALRHPKIRKAVDALLAERLVFMGDNGETPIITDRGRALVDGPSAAELLYADFRGVRDGISAANDAQPAVETDQKRRAAERREVALQTSRRLEERVAMLLCVHDESPTYMRVSLDGNEKGAQNIYTTAMFGVPPIVVTARSGQFALAHLRGREVIKFGFTQPNAPLLSSELKWSEADVRAWRDLRLELLKLRHGIQQLNRRARRAPKVYSPRRFGETA